MIENVVYLLGNLFRIYIYRKLLIALFKRAKVCLSIEIIAFLSYYAVNSAVCLLFNNFSLNIATNIIPLILLTFLYESKLSSKIFVSIAFYVVNMMIDAIMYATLLTIGKSLIIIKSGVATVLFTFLAELIFEYNINKRMQIELDRAHFITIISIPIGCIIIGIITMQQYNLKSIMVSLILILFNIMVFYLYDRLQKSYETAYENRMLEQAIESKNTQVKLVKEAEEKISFLRHDFKNHLISIEMYAESNDCNGIIEYIHSAFDFLKIENQVTHSGNFDVDSILNYKLQEMKQKNVDITCSVNIPCELNIENFDINIILGNLMNNAMEAMDKVEKKIFSLKISFNSNIIFIHMRNTYDGNEKKSGKCFITTKEDKCLHGIGLKSVEKILKKYNGTLSCFTNKKSNVFVTEAMLYNIPINRH